MYSKEETIGLMNKWGSNNQPFLFILDFEGKTNKLFPLDNIPENVHYQIAASYKQSPGVYNDFLFEAKAIDLETYSNSFHRVVDELNYGNSYLINLTFPSVLATDLNLRSIYDRSSAKYKLLVDDKFVVFSPECFVKIIGHKIYSYPMKGTIDADHPDAEKHILTDPKEIAEHTTIVDLIRNDLNKISENVRVKRFRYIERIETLKGPLLQVSSEIVGDLAKDFNSELGSLIFSMLPAGSISGAPKKKTVEIIKETEIVERGFFTGVFGVYDGKMLDSAVMIRFIEKKGEDLIFRSGGGITSQSKMEAEYNEMIQKVYVPFV